MELKVGATYKTIEILTDHLEGLSKMTTLTKAVVLDVMRDDNGQIEYVLGAPPCSIPADWIQSAEEYD